MVTKLTPWSKVILDKLMFTQLVMKSPSFYGTLLCSQESATGPYLEPDESSPHLPILRPIYVRCFIILFVTVVLRNAESDSFILKLE